MSYCPCACSCSSCPGKKGIPYYNGWMYGLCQSMSSMGSEDYTDAQPRYPNASPEAAREPYYSASMSGALNYDHYSSGSSFSTVAGPSGTQSGQQNQQDQQGETGYNANQEMSYDYEGAIYLTAMPDDPIPGPGMEGNQQYVSEGSGGNSSSSSNSHSKASSSKSGSSRRSHKKSKK